MSPAISVAKPAVEAANALPLRTLASPQCSASAQCHARDAPPRMSEESMPSSSRLAVAVFVVLVATLALPASAGMRVVATASFAGPGRHPGPYAVDPVARKAFVGIHGASPALLVLDLDTLATREIRLAGWPLGVIADAAHARIYVLGQRDPVEFGDSHITVIDARTEVALADVAIGTFPRQFAADPWRRELYVPEDRFLVTIDADTLQVKSRIDLRIYGAGVAVDRVRRRIVVGNAEPGAERLAVVDSGAERLMYLPSVIDRGRQDQDGAAWPLADERSGTVYVQHGDGRVTLLVAPAYQVTLEFDPTDAWYEYERSSLSQAWGRLYQIGYARDHDEWWPVSPSKAALRAVDATAGPAVIAGLPGDDNNTSRTLIVDDDGGDLYVTVGPPSRYLLRVDPATLRVRESLADADLAAELAFRDPVTQRLFLVGEALVHVIETQGERAGTRIATGFRHDAFDHYFVTADPVESRLIDDGRYGSDWGASEDLFRVWTEPVAGSVPVCRFFSARFAPRSSHVYTPYAGECEALKRGGEWQYEGIAFHIALPVAPGACPAGTEPLYRLYNEGRGGAPNHRYTASSQTVAAMTANGWSAEGTGPGRVFACTPALR
jgi:DNA-binding beta-propeller fold protein YncE